MKHRFHKLWTSAASQSSPALRSVIHRRGVRQCFLCRRVSASYCQYYPAELVKQVSLDLRWGVRSGTLLLPPVNIMYKHIRDPCHGQIRAYIVASFMVYIDHTVVNILMASTLWLNGIYGQKHHRTRRSSTCSVYARQQIPLAVAVTLLLYYWCFIILEPTRVRRLCFQENLDVYKEILDETELTRVISAQSNIAIPWTSRCACSSYTEFMMQC